MNKTFFTFLLSVISINSDSLLSMQVEVKTNVAELVVSRADAADRKAEIAATHAAQVAFSDALCPEGLSADIWALITDYAVDMSTEHELFTHSKTFIGPEIKEGGLVVSSDSRGYRSTGYSFKDKVHRPFNQRQDLKDLLAKLSKTITLKTSLNDSEKVSEVSAYRDHGATLVNKFSVQEPMHIESYSKGLDAEVALVITDNDAYYELVVWNAESNKIEYSDKLSCLIDCIIPLSKGRFALIVRGQNSIIIKDLIIRKDSEIVLKERFKASDRLFELEPGPIFLLEQNGESGNFYQIYPASVRIDADLLVAYLNLRTIKEGRWIFQDGQIFQKLEQMGFKGEWTSFASLSTPKRIVWYDQEAVMQIRKLSLAVKEKLKEFLPIWRERQAKLIAANAAEPFKFEATELVFLNSLPVRVQENIKSHFLSDIVYVGIKN